MEGWEDEDASPDSTAVKGEGPSGDSGSRLPDIRRRFCACGHLVQARAVFSRTEGVPRWTLVYSCTRGLSTEGHLHEEFDPLQLSPALRIGFAPFFLEGEPDMDQLGDGEKAALGLLDEVQHRLAGATMAPAAPTGSAAAATAVDASERTASLLRFGLSPAQVQNIIANPNLKRTLLACPGCAETRPMIIWQLSAPDMEFCCICPACRRVFDLKEVM